MTVSNGSVTSQPFPVQIGVPNAQVSSAAARRFLEQAAFGPTPSDAANVQTLGFQGWLTQQFSMAAGVQLQHHYIQPGRDAGAFPDQRRDEFGSIAPARRVRTQPDLRNFAPEADLERQYGSVPEHAAGRRIHQLPPDHGRRDAESRHGPVSRHGQQRHGESRRRARSPTRTMRAN